MPQTRTSAKSKSQQTSLRILEAALELFRVQGYDQTTMRDVAARAGVATGAAYYYFESKDAIVREFYALASKAMRARLDIVVSGEAGLENKLRAMLRVKLDSFAPFRGVLRRVHDPAARGLDAALFQRIVKQSAARAPRDLAPHLPALLAMHQSWVIDFWLADESPCQARTARLIDVSTRFAALLLRFAALPAARPLRKAAIELIAIALEPHPPSAAPGDL